MIRKTTIWLIPPLLVLILARALLVHGDLTDFPMDRNLSAGFHISRFARYTAWGELNGDWAKYRLLIQQPETPEFPLIPLAARVLTDFKIPPLVAARIFSLIASALTGIGLYLLGSRLASRRVGLAAVWIFALVPFSIFMGRSLLPDTAMMAAVTWSLVAAGAPGYKSNWRRAGAATCWLCLAALAKMPAVFFAPVAAAMMMQHLGWRRRDAWIKLAAVTLTTYLVVCVWYKMAPWNPLPGLARISAATNNILATREDLLGLKTLWVSAMRVVLALSLPGIFLMLAGIFFLQTRPDRLPYNIWILLALIFVPLTIRANTYWAYAVVPVGCLIGGLGLEGLWRMFPPGKPSLARGLLQGTVLGIVLAGLLWACPSVGKIEEYLVVHPEYERLRAAAQKTMSSNALDEVYYLGKIPGDLMYFVGHRGTQSSSDNATKVLAELGLSKPASPGGSTSSTQATRYRYLVSNRMDEGSVTGALFDRCPIQATSGGEFVIFNLADKKSLGENVAGIAPSAFKPLDLDGRLRIVDLSAAPTRVTPGGQLKLEITFEKGPKYDGPPRLTLEMIHRASKINFAPSPAAGGLALSRWSLPRLQTPGFSDAPRKKMRYTFDLPPGLPAGPYQFRFSIGSGGSDPGLHGAGMKDILANDLPGVEIMAPVRMAAASQTLRLGDGYWHNPPLITKVDWLGRRREVADINASGEIWLSPALQEGIYRLLITAHGVAAGEDPKEKWPVLRVRQPGGGQRTVEVAFESASSRTVSLPLHWTGPGDFLDFSLANPARDLTPFDPFTLYLKEPPRGSRAVMIENIRILKAE